MTDASRSAVAALLGLTFVTGIIDAVSVLGLGHVFVANMTGNVVFVGFALAGKGNASLSAGALALGGFLLGALIGGRLMRSGKKLPRVGFALELALLTLAGCLAFVSRGASAAQLLVPTLAIAMGLRNALVRALAVPDLTTTVLTLTLTGLAADSSLAGGTNPRLARRLAAVAAMLAGAFAGALMLAKTPSLVIGFAALLEGIAIFALVRTPLAQPSAA